MVEYSFYYFAVPSAAPLNVSARIVDTTTIELAWVEPPVETQNGIIISYRINVAISETKTSFSVNATTAAAVNLTELHPYYGYSIQVAAVTSQGAGPLSDPVSITTPEDGRFYHTTKNNKINCYKRAVQTS